MYIIDDKSIDALTPYRPVVSRDPVRFSVSPTTTMPGPSLSDRGRTRASIPLSYTTDKFYDKELNPQGLINLGTAENTLMSEELLKVTA